LAIDSSGYPVSERFTELAVRLGESLASDGSLFGVEVPLRVCPLGAHVDHQGGMVTGMTVDRSVLMAAIESNGPEFAIDSMDFPGSVTVDVTAEYEPAKGHWGDYVRAAVAALGSEYTLRRGLRAVISGELAGSGLSSSAAVLIAYLTGLARVNGIELTPTETALLVQRAENSYIGVASGLLDPSVMVHAERGKLTLIDCLDTSVRQIESPLLSDPVAVVVAFSGAARTLVGSGFNRRVDECRRAARTLLATSGGTPTPESRLRDVERAVFAEEGHRLPRNLRQRAAHFFGEMERVTEGVEAWGRGDVVRFGELMTMSGESSIIRYECGTEPLETLFELLRNEPGVYGARFSGGGFGGTCIALAAPEACAEIVASVARRYDEQHPDLARNAAYRVCDTAGPMRVFQPEY
jgi:galactokinase